MDVLARVDVLGDREELEAAHRLEGLAAEDGAAADEEGSAPAIALGLDAVVEHVLLVRHPAARAKRVLEHVRVAEMVGRLDEAHPGIDEVGNGLFEEIRRRDVIRIEDGDQLAIGLRDRMIEVAGLRVLFRSFPVGRSPPPCELAHGIAMTVVEDVDTDVRMAHRARRDEGPLEDLEGLLEDRNHHVDARCKARRLGTPRARSSPETRLDDQQHHRREAVELGDPERRADERARRLDEVEGMLAAPDEVEGTDREGGGEERKSTGRLEARSAGEKDQGKEQATGEEGPFREARLERTVVEGQQEAQPLVVLARESEREGLVEGEPVVEVVGRLAPDEGLLPEAFELLGSDLLGELGVDDVGQRMERRVERERLEFRAGTAVRAVAVEEPAIPLIGRPQWRQHLFPQRALHPPMPAPIRGHAPVDRKDVVAEIADRAGAGIFEADDLLLAIEVDALGWKLEVLFDED